MARWQGLITKTIIALTALTLFAACDSPSPFSSLRKPNMTPLSPKLQKLFEKTRPVCFGRFVIDVPVGTKIGWGPTKIPYSIVSYGNQADKVPTEIKAKLAEYAAEKHKIAPAMLLQVMNGPNPESKIVIGYSDNSDDTAVDINAYLRLPPNGFVMTVRDALSAGELLGQKIDINEQWPTALAKVDDVISRLRPRPDDEVPTDPGICIESGFVAETEGKFYELISIGFRVLPDVHLAIQTIHADKPFGEAESLQASLEGGKKDAQALGKGDEYAKIKWFRKDQREVAGVAGYEALARYPASQGNAHDFRFVALGQAKNPLKPLIDIKLDTGAVDDQPGKTSPSLSDEEAVALWDKLLSSIRPRPVAAAKPSARPGPTSDSGSARRLPLGTQVSSLRSCPESGMYECASDTPNVLQRRVYIAQGRPMPSAFKLSSKRGLQGILGAQEQKEVETIWTLMSYEKQDA